MVDSDAIFGIMASFGKSRYSVQALIAFCEVLGVKENSVRTNLHRMIKKGVLDSERVGKQAFYFFARKGVKIARNVARGFVTPDWSNWDCQWRGILFSVPAAQKPLRHKIRRKLELYRFASLYPGFWMRPFLKELDDLVYILDGPIGKFCEPIIFKPDNPFSMKSIGDLWSIEQIHREMVEGLCFVKQEIRNIASATPEEAFRKKMFMGEKMVSLLFKDPLLPEQFLPRDWCAPLLRKSFVDFNSLASLRSESLIEKIFKEDQDG